MIELQPKGRQKPLTELRKPRFWPMPGLLHVVIGLIVVVLLAAGFLGSTHLLDLILKRSEAGTASGFGAGVHLLFAGWLGIAVAAALLLTVVESFGGPERLRAIFDQEAWFRYGKASAHIREILHKDEVPVGYVEVDHPDMSAPKLFERLFLLLLILSHVGVLAAVHRLASNDGYQAFTLWVSFAPVATLVVCGAFACCRPSSGFLILVMAIFPIFHRVHWKIDPVATGPALGLPPLSLPIGLVLLVLLTGIHLLRAQRDHSLLVVTNRGVRRFHVSGSEATLVDKADHPLVMVATPTASGCRMQIGGSQGREKLRPVHLVGPNESEAVAAAARPHSEKTILEGSGEPSGIAGRLGELPMLGVAFVLLLALVTHQMLLPPVIGRLETQRLLDQHQEEWVAGKGMPLADDLGKLLAANPALGPARLIRAQILADSGHPDQAAREVDEFLRRRAPWASSALVVQAEALRATLSAPAPGAPANPP